MLASDSVKTRFPLGPYYRLAYNGFALLHIGTVWWLGRYWLAGAPPLGISPVLGLIGDAVTVLGVTIIGVALLGYDRGRFLGTTQVRSPESEADEELRTGGLHRYVRHPLYSGVFLVLWGHAQTEFSLATALWGSIYLLIGAMYEERRLIGRYGEAYIAYRRRVPAYIPRRGRVRPERDS